MSGAEDFIRAILDAAKPAGGLLVAVGSVRVQAAGDGTPQTALVKGVADEPIAVTSESWGSPFVASASAGVPDDSLVLLLFNRGQAIIVCTLGV